MMELRNVMPKRVMKPTIEPIERSQPEAKTARTPPTRANGKFKNKRKKSRKFRMTIATIIMIPAPAKKAWKRRSLCDCVRAWAVPENSI